jgi:hypothetical protein
MIAGLGRRVKRLERGHSLALPWHRPAREWSDPQLIACIAITYPDVKAGVSEERLLEIIADDQGAPTGTGVRSPWA